jgi:hypothetical protein
MKIYTCGPTVNRPNWDQGGSDNFGTFTSIPED